MNELKNYLALDLGASGMRLFAGRLDIQTDTMDLTELARCEYEASRDVSGRLVWPIAKIIAQIRENLMQLMQHSCTYRSIGVDSWGVDYLLLDELQQIAAPMYSYRDERTQGSYGELEELMNLQELYERTGSQFMEPNTLCQLFVARNEDYFGRVRHFLMVSDYIAFCLCASFANEASLASTSQLYSLQNGNWDFALLRRLQIPTSMFQKILPIGTILAQQLREELRGGALADCRMLQVASHDTASAVIAIPFEETTAAHLFLSSGTWSVMGYELDAPITSAEAQRENFANEIGYGGSIRFAKSLLGLWLLQELRRELAPATSYAELEDLARRETPYHTLFPASHSSLLLSGCMSSRIQDLCQRAGELIPKNFGAMVRSIYDSLSLEYRSCYEALQRISGKRANAIHIVGGGSQSALLNQLCADALGLPVYAGPVDAAAAGNILAQIIADESTGCDNLKEARSLSHRSFPIETFWPQAPLAKIYPIYQRYQKISERLCVNHGADV